MLLRISLAYFITVININVIHIWMTSLSAEVPRQKCFIPLSQFVPSIYLRSICYLNSCSIPPPSSGSVNKGQQFINVTLDWLFALVIGRFFEWVFAIGTELRVTDKQINWWPKTRKWLNVIPLILTQYTTGRHMHTRVIECISGMELCWLM